MRDQDAEIADLKNGLAAKEVDLAAARKEHEPCPGIIDALRTDLLELEKTKQAQIDELKAHLAKLDKSLAEEIEKEHALAAQLDEEKKKEAELELSLAKEKKNLATTKAELEKDEKNLAEDQKVFASKDAEIADLKKRLADLQKEHNPCPGHATVVLVLFVCACIVCVTVFVRSCVRNVCA